MNNWTKEEQNQLRNLVIRGCNLKEIWLIFKEKSSHDISKQLEKQNLKILQARTEKITDKIVELFNKGKTSGQIAIELSLNAQYVANKIYLIKQRNQMGQNSWKPEEVSKALKMKEEGSSIPEIAGFIGRTDSAVVSKLHSLKIAPKIRITKEGEPINKNTPWTPEDDAILLKARAKGESFTQIGERLGRSRDSSYQRHKVVTERLLVPKMSEIKSIDNPIIKPKEFDYLSAIKTLVESGKKGILYIQL